eukprot:9841008-Lingulodinium_polyedra.AAC.1
MYNVQCEVPEPILREVLLEQMKQSKVLGLDLHAFERLEDGDPTKNHQALSEIMTRQIRLT